MATILCVLYDDPVDGYPPPTRATASPRSRATPAASRRRRPRRSTSRRATCSAACPASSACAAFLEERGHTLIVTADKDGPDSEFERRLPDADVVISQPFWPAYLTAERIAKAPNLKLAITAGIGSDHVDLQAAIEHDVTVAEVTYCNSISVAEHVVMLILVLVRNYLPVVRVGDGRRLEHRRLRRRARTTWRACRSARSAPGASARPCSAG